MTPNARTLKLYEQKGYLTVIVEKWVPFPKPWGKTHDFLGIFDLLAFKAGEPPIGLQATGDNGGHVANRIAKMRASPNLARWYAIGGRAVAVGWKKRGPRGGRKTWQPREVVLEAQEFNVAPQGDQQ